MKYKVYAGYYEIYVSQSELDKPYMLQFESDDADKVLDYLKDIDDTVLVEDSIADEIPNYNFRFEIKNENIELVDYESGGIK